MGSSRRSVPHTNLTPPATTLLPPKSHAEEPLTAFFDHLAQIRILDPACGSGNFLYVALRRLLDLWKEARDFAIANNIHIATGYIADRMPSPLQLFGIETEFYAHELASIVVWIGSLQWKHDNGIQSDPDKKILERLNNIQKDDAILRYDPEGNPYEPEWPKADFIIGNPPFVGGTELRIKLGDEYAEHLTELYRERLPARVNLVTYWFEKARRNIEHGNAERAGLLATQAIRQGVSRMVLDRIKESGDIFFALSDRQWSLDGASVRTSMVGFDSGIQTARTLDGLQVNSINSRLQSSESDDRASPLRENKAIAFQGVILVGSFEITADTARKLLVAPLNPNGRSNADVISPLVSGDDVTGRGHNKYLIDFSICEREDEAALYELPFELIKSLVRAQRATSRSGDRTGVVWWRLQRSRPRMREALKTLPRYIATPRVSKHRLFVWVDRERIPDTRLFVFARDDDYFFGVLHSRPHELWALWNASIHGDGDEGGRPTYTIDACFQNFPFPWPPSNEPTEAEDPRVQAIAEAARTLVRLRDAWLNPPGALEPDLKDRTLTKLYNLRAAGKCTWLEDAHRTLDQAVFAAYGWPPTLTTQQILANLLALNHERAAAQPPSAPRRLSSRKKRQNAASPNETTT